MRKLLNITKETEILNKVESAETFLTRLKGLLGRASLEQGSGIVIDPCNSVHCFFMRFPIDVAFVDKDNKVLNVISNMKPWSISPIVLKSKYVIESNAGELSGTLEKGDVLQII